MIYKGLLFKNRKFNKEKLKKYGFVLTDGIYKYTVFLSDKTFSLEITIKNDILSTKLIEISTNSEYTLIYIKSAQGEFVGKLRQEFEKILEDISNNCTDFSVFQSQYAYKIIDYINNKYSIKPEYLWEKFPNNAIFRKNDKWFCAILSAKKKNFYKDEPGEIELIDLKIDPVKIDELIDNEKYYRGYHMNKKHWFTILLDGKVELDEIYKRIDDSYNLIK